MKTDMYILNSVQNQGHFGSPMVDEDLNSTLNNKSTHHMFNVHDTVYVCIMLCYDCWPLI